MKLENVTEALLGMFIGIFSEFHVRCGTDLTRSTYCTAECAKQQQQHTCSDIHKKLSLVVNG